TSTTILVCVEENYPKFCRVMSLSGSNAWVQVQRSSERACRIAILFLAFLLSHSSPSTPSGIFQRDPWIVTAESCNRLGQLTSGSSIEEASSGLLQLALRDHWLPQTDKPL